MGRKPKKTTEKTDYASLSDRQRRILNVISDAVMLRGYPPSIREIGDAAGLQSTSSVAYQLKQLEEKGFLRRDPNKPRAVDVRHLNTDDGAKKPGRKPAKPEQQVPAEAGAVSYIPVVGRIAAGAPITAEENVDTYFPMPDEVVGGGLIELGQVVAGDEDGLPHLLQLDQKRLHLEPGAGVEARGGLVEEEHLRVRHQSASQLDALALPR